MVCVHAVRVVTSLGLQPVSLEVSVIQGVLKEVEQADVHFQVGFNRRFDPSFQRVRQAVEAGEIGDLHQIRITSRDPSPPPLSYVKVGGTPPVNLECSTGGVVTLLLPG